MHRPERDSEATDAQAQSHWRQALLEELGLAEEDLEAVIKPRREDYRLGKAGDLKYQIARGYYNGEIRAIWDRIHKLMREWPAGC